MEMTFWMLVLFASYVVEMVIVVVPLALLIVGGIKFYEYWKSCGDSDSLNTPGE